MNSGKNPYVKSTVNKEYVRDMVVDYVKDRQEMHNMHYHRAFEIYILEKGERTYIIGNNLVEVNANDVILLKPNVVHSVMGSAYERYVIAFEQEYLDRYLGPEAQNKLMSCFAKVKIHVAPSEFEKLIFLTKRLISDSEDFVSFTRILSILCKSASTDVYNVSRENKLISDIMHYIGTNYRKNESLEEIASKFAISKYHLCHLFKQHSGSTVVKHINALKIRDACKMLDNKKASIDEIASECGFNSAMYFCRIFKQITGVTPSMWRVSEK